LSGEKHQIQLSRNPSPANYRPLDCRLGPGVTGGFRLSENLTEPAEKILPVQVIPVNTAALNHTADNMLQRSGGINAGSARHTGISPKPIQQIKH
jgi:hypothetical protein